MAVTAQQVKELRIKTGAGLMACKKALEESDGDIEKAIESLRKKGAAKAASKSERSTNEGSIVISGRAIVKILCETDFVGKNEQFIAFVKEIADKASSDGEDAAKQLFEDIKSDKIQAIGENLVLDFVQVVKSGNIAGSYVHGNGKIATLVTLDGGTEEMARDAAMHATAMNPLVANPEDVAQEDIDKEMAFAKQQLLDDGKPEQIIGKILEGKTKKFCAERALTSQAFVKNPDQTVGEYLGDAKLVEFVRIAV
jgi:elongation factor Ts